jgi:polyphosphate kinase
MLLHVAPLSAAREGPGMNKTAEAAILTANTEQAAVGPDRTEPASPAPLDLTPDRFINRELSWLAFNDRVLGEANNAKHPLLERLRFLSISASNLDEFIMVRVAALKAQVRAGVKTVTPDNLLPEQQLALINQAITKLNEAQQRCFQNLRTELREAGITVVDPAGLSK